MTKPMFTGARGQRAENALCCYPGCSMRNIEIVPLCRNHAIKVWAIVHNEAQMLIDRPPSAPRPRMQGDGIVYFVRFDQRVKIGWTQNLPQRLAAIPHEEVLATVPGTMTDEKRCHAAFAHLRETGEWFRAEAELLDFIEDIKRKHEQAA